MCVLETHNKRAELPSKVRVIIPCNGLWVAKKKRTKKQNKKEEKWKGGGKDRERATSARCSNNLV